MASGKAFKPTIDANTTGIDGDSHRNKRTESERGIDCSSEGICPGTSTCQTRCQVYCHYVQGSYMYIQRSVVSRIE